MSTVSQLKMWKDVGFTETCMEVPKASSVLPTPDLTFSDLNPTKARMFSEIRVPEDYVTLLDYSYLSIVVEGNNGPDRTFYGWIDSVEMVSDTLGAPMTAVHWHVDLWRTYFPRAEFGSGIVRRRTASGDLPPQPYPHRFLVPGTVKNLVTGGVFWVIVNVVKNVEGGTPEEPVTYSEFETRCYPISRSLDVYYVGGGGGTAVQVPNISETVAGRWDELWGIDPESVTGAFISPIPPSTVNGSGTQSSPFTILSYGSGSGVSRGYLYFRPATAQYSVLGPSIPIEADLGAAYTTTDVDRYVFTGFDGEVAGEVPWGSTVRYYTYRLVISSTSCYMEFRFSATRDAGTFESVRYMNSRAQGTCFTLPCITLDVTSNSWSSYNYSGSRSYEMSSRQLESDKRLQEGQMDVVTNTIMGAMSGATAGGSGFLTGLFGGGVAGAAVGGAAAGVATEAALAAQYAYETTVYNDRVQELSDYKAATQTNGILTPGTDWDSVFYGRVPSLVKMSTDSYSQTQRSNDMAVYGAHVSEPKSDCTSTIAGEGPLQIANLVVKGDVPPVAKNHIKQRFAQGVIIK